jgi:alpha-glucosidase
MDPEFTPTAGLGRMTPTGTHRTLRAAGIEASWDMNHPTVIEFRDKDHKKLLTTDLATVPVNQSLAFHHPPGENLYGMRAMDRDQKSGSLLRNDGADIKAGIQGDGGAPFFFTTRYGVLFDSDGGKFSTTPDTITFSGSSRKDVEFFIIAGSPKEIMGSIATLTGKSPMPPKFTLGFMNSQWGSTEDELKQIVATYREKHEPLDVFILDFDWKAWGQDNYGEWRWNSNAGPGAVEPDKFPDGASGLFAKQMAEQGVKLAGILKPRILVQSPTDPNKKMIAAQYALDHGYGYPDEKLDKDYVTHQQAMNIDFNNPGARKWYWEHLKPAFDAGMSAWWNDEADYSATTVFNNFQHVNMGRTLYEGQRADGLASDKRVWSINRNYYLGGLRYGFAEWSGDISTGFESMARQRVRMLQTMDIGEPLWSMDTGGFSGHPSNENYARWMEFSAFVPIFRVHGDHNLKRQPWVYGPVAEAAAKNAMELRYSLMPYLYSATEEMHRTGIGLVRPMFWEFPGDPSVATIDSEWMFGDAFLVSPVVTEGATSQKVYLPAGEWFDYLKGTKYTGGQTIDYTVDPTTWKDIPLFVRAGSIIATQTPQEFTDQHPVTEIALDIFPGSHTATFTLYDDDGTDYAYEGGAFFRQKITASANGTITLAVPEGKFARPLKTYKVHIHAAAKSVTVDGKKAVAIITTDKYGPVAEVSIPVGRHEIVVR